LANTSKVGSWVSAGYVGKIKVEVERAGKKKRGEGVGPAWGNRLKRLGGKEISFSIFITLYKL
jgi:hypothetical protein